MLTVISREIRFDLNFVLKLGRFLCLHEAGQTVDGFLLSDGELVRVDLLLLLLSPFGFHWRRLHRGDV